MIGSGPRDPRAAAPPTYVLRTPQHDWAICSTGCGEHTALLFITAPTLGYYAARHGFDLILVTDRVEPSRPPAWDKVALIRRVLQQYQGVVWIDADAIIVAPEEDVRTLLTPRPIHWVVHRYWGRAFPNTGVWAFRNEPGAHEFLDAVWALNQFTHHPWWENAAAMHLLGYDPVPGASVYRGPTRWSALVGELPVKWNSIDLHADPQPAIRHFAGMPLPYRKIALHSAYGEFLYHTRAA